MIVRAGWVVPVEGPAIPDGFVEFRDDRIVRVGSAKELGALPVEHAFPRGVLTPGLVNPHTHLELTDLALPRSDFWTWARALVARRGEPGAHDVAATGVARGARLSLEAGVTCVGDISRSNLHWPILRQSPIRKVCFVELLAFALEPARTLAELRAGVEAVDEDALLTVGVSPHAPYSVSSADLYGSAAYATTLDRPWCVHFAETREEVAFLAGDDRGLTASLRERMANCGIASPRTSAGAYFAEFATACRPGLLVHGNYLTPTDLAALRTVEPTVIYCPRAHAYFGHTDYPLRMLLDAGLRVVLGTDGLPCSTTLSPLDEARFVAAHDPVVDGASLLRMITLDSAAALGLAERIGSLAVGKCADLAVFELDAPTDEPIDALFRATCVRPAAVWVAGQQVVGQSSTGAVTCRRS